MEQIDLTEQQEERPKVQRVIVVPPAAPGSKEDEGMLLGALQILNSVPIHLLNPETGRAWGDVLSKSGNLSSVTEYQGAFSDFLPHIQSTDAVLIVGSDVIDGTHGLEPALERLNFLDEAILRSACGAIVCSFRPDVDQYIVHRLKNLQHVSIFLHDLTSLDNYGTQVGSQAAFFPDLSRFAVPLDPQDQYCDPELIAWISQIHERGGKVVGLNFSEQMFRSLSDDCSDEARFALLRTGIDEIQKAIPGVHFVLMSDDHRRRTNLISDIDYQELTAEVLARKTGGDHFKICDPHISYLGNVVLMRSLDLLVTGEMHLALAAIRQDTVPLIVMGPGRGHMSTDEMRGMYQTVFGVNTGVVGTIEELSVAVSWAQKQALYLRERLTQWNDITRFEENALRSMLGRSLGVSDTFPSREETVVRVLHKREIEARRVLTQRELSAEDDAAQAANENLALERKNQNLEQQRDAQHAALETLMIEADRLARQLYRAYHKPWRPIQRCFKSALLKIILVFRPLLPKHAVDQLQDSRRKRKPSRIRSRWARFRGNIESAIGLQFQAPAAPAGTAIGLDAGMVDAYRARRVFVSDHRLPQAGVSSSELATIQLIGQLCAIGYDVVFAPTDMSITSPYLKELQALGVEVITEQSGYSHAGDYVREKGGRFGVFYLIQVDAAEELLPVIRDVAPDARIIFHTPGACFLRESRAAALKVGASARKSTERAKARETAMMQAADHVVIAGQAEPSYIKNVVSLDKVSILPAPYKAVAPEAIDYGDRQHVCFIGGFAHTANVGAVVWFVENVWPAIFAAIPEAEFHILGADLPEEVSRLGRRPGVRCILSIANLAPVLAKYRVSVVPTLYGAGRKLRTAMGAGTPSVMTTPAAEGMNVTDGIHALVRDDPKFFAEAVVGLYRNKNLWGKISVSGRALVEGSFSAVANQTAFSHVLDRAGALSIDLYADYLETVAAQALLPAMSSQQAVKVSIIIPVHDQWSQTRRCLNSVLDACRFAGVAYEIILADDASDDETISAAGEFPNLRVVRQNRNLGFLRNCNAAAAVARGEYLLLLHNDTVVLPNWLRALMDTAAKYPDAAIIGSKLISRSGAIQHAGAVFFADSTIATLGRDQLRDDPRFCFDREVDSVNSASMLISRAFWGRVGGFDERFASLSCEEADLAMAARANGLRVVYAAESEVVYFDDDGLDARLNATLKAHQNANNKKLRDKWCKEFATDYLPVSTPEDVAAAYAERNSARSQKARRRRKEQLNILYFSPFPSHPDSHGNQATIQSFGRHFKRLGHKVHFALLNSTMFDDAAVDAMREAWDTFDILHNTRQLSADGNVIPFDHWYQDGLGEEVAGLCRRYGIDIVFCSYIFQSKLLQYVPSHILKVIDTHDKMGDRYEMLQKNGQPLEFFSCSLEEEGKYLQRADVVVARRAEEARYFDEVSGRTMSIVVPHVEEARFVGRDFTKVDNVGVVASANRINLAVILELVRTIGDRQNDIAIPFTLHIAGQVREMINLLPYGDQVRFSQPWIQLHGFVPNIAEFYRRMDIVISPITMGTGINVKTVQAMAYGMPLLSTAWGSKGIETQEPMHLHADLSLLCDGLFDICRNPSRLGHLAAASRATYGKFYYDAVESIDQLIEKVKV